MTGKEFLDDCFAEIISETMKEALDFRKENDILHVDKDTCPIAAYELGKIEGRLITMATVRDMLFHEGEMTSMEDMIKNAFSFAFSEQNTDVMN